MKAQHQACIVKQIVTNGTECPKPELNSKVLFKTWHSDKDRENSFSYSAVLGSGELQKSLQEIILSMRKGDIREIQIWNKLCQANENLCVELSQIESSEAMSQQNNKIIQAQKHKDQGNDFYKSKQFQRAKQEYITALDLLRFNQKQQAIKLKLTVLSNLAQVNLSLKKFDQSKTWCLKYRQQSQQKNPKIEYRLIQAEIQMKNWENARKLIKQNCETYQDAPEELNNFKKLGKQIENAQKKEQQQVKKTYTRMFG